MRRNPRTERAAAACHGTSRPRFDLTIRGGARPRRDPRAEVAGQRISSPSLPRLDRSQRTAGFTPSPVAREPVAATPSIISVDAPAFLVAVVPDGLDGRLSVHDRQLFGAARALAGKTGAVVAIVASGCEIGGTTGADRVLTIYQDDLAEYAPEKRAGLVAAACKDLAARHVLFPETAEGSDLARRVAVTMGDALFTNAELVSETSLVRAVRARRVEQRGVPTRLISVALDAAAVYAGPPREARMETIRVAATTTASPILATQKIPADPAHMLLALADFVVAAGNGVTDLATFKRLAAALCATPGASRVLCDAGLMPRATQVGASGTVLAATCYLAIGIAGAPQHLQGIAGCEHVIAVNTDLHAAMVERAGLAIVADAQLVMPALLEALARETGGPT